MLDGGGDLRDMAWILRIVAVPMERCPRGFPSAVRR